MSKANSKADCMAEDQDILTRRGFVRGALGGVGLCYAAAIGYPVYRYLKSPVERAAAAAAVTEVALNDAQKLPAGTVQMFRFGSKPAMLIHHADGSWVAFDAVCTHLGCTVQYQPDKDRIHCACHGGVYDAHTGKNVSGPPPRPLMKYEVKPTPGGLLVSRTQAGNA
jgi:cytochrome b6-f complex iron-sulfur subunit